MYRIVFYCSTILLLGVCVNSKHNEQIHLNDGNQIIYTVHKSSIQPKEQHEITVEEEPSAIIDISNQVAKFILYFIKKYCKNGKNIEYLENLLATKSIGSLFKINDGEANYGHLENSKPLKIKSIKPKVNVIEEQGHGINYNFDTAPNYKIQIPTTHAERKQNKLIHKVELTTENIHTSKQYKVPKFMRIENDKPKETIEKPQEIHIKVPAYQTNINYAHERPGTFKVEPMYEYASHGDEYGINDNEYSLPEYDYSMYPVDDIKPSISHQKVIIPEHHPKIQQNIIHDKHYYEHTTTKVETKRPSILDDLYKYMMPEEKPEVQFINHEQTTVKDNVIFAENDKNEPSIFDTFYNYMMPETTTEISRKIDKINEPTQPENSNENYGWFNYQPEVTTKPSVQSTFDLSDVEPQGVWFDFEHKIKPEITEKPRVHFYKYGSSEIPKSWFDFEDKMEEPQIHFADNKPSNLNDPFLREHSFEYPMFQYELNPNRKQSIQESSEETMPQTGPHVHFNEIEPHMQEHVFENSMPEQPEVNNWFTHQEVTPKFEENLQFHEPTPQSTVEYSSPSPIQLSTTFEDKPEMDYVQPAVNMKGPEVKTYEYSFPGYHSSHQYNFRPNTPPHNDIHLKVHNEDIPKSSVKNYADDLLDKYIVEEKPEMDFVQPAVNMKGPVVKTYEYSFPGYHLSHQYNFKPNTPRRNDFHLNVQNEDIPKSSVKNYADDLFNKYIVELLNLDEMKKYYKGTVPDSIYWQFVNNVDKMRDVLNGWKNGPHFYDSQNIENVKKTMTKLGKETLELVKPKIDYVATTPIYEKTTEPMVSRRTFDHLDEITKYLEDPKAKKGFDEMDPLLQNAILAYIDYAKRERTPDVKTKLLILLHKIKYLMTNYNNIFNKLQWVNKEIEDLTKDNDVSPPTPEQLDNFYKSFFKDNWYLTNNMDFAEKSKLFISLFNIPLNVESKHDLENLINNLLKDVIRISKKDPEFKNVKFFLGEHKSYESSPLFNSLLTFAVSPKDYLEQTENTETLGSRRVFSEITTKALETKTEMPITTEMPTTEIPTTTEIVEISQSTPKKKIEKHKNIFREFLMNSD